MNVIRHFALAITLSTVALGCAGHTPVTVGSSAPAQVPLPTPPKIIPQVRLVGDTNAVPAFPDTAPMTWGTRAEGQGPHIFAARIRSSESGRAHSVRLEATRGDRIHDRHGRRIGSRNTLASFPGDETGSLLASEAGADMPPIVCGIALASYRRVAGDSALRLAGEVMAEKSWRNVLRTPAVAVLKGMQGAAGQSLYEMYAKK